MVRNYRKNRAPPQTHSPETVLRAVKAVKVENKSIRCVSEDMKIPYRTLTRYCRKVHSQQLTENHTVSKQVFRPADIAARRVFSHVEERELAAIIKKAMGTYYGMTGKQIRHLAYESAIAFRCEFPTSWMKKQQAGHDWFLEFMKRHKELTTGAGEASLLPISTPCCIKNIDHYWKNFKVLLDRFNLGPENIWCMGEMAVSTLPRQHRVFARRGIRPETQMALCTNRENAVSMALCISAAGGSVPVFLLVPPVPKKSASSSNCEAARPPEWLNKSLFLEFLKHFVQHSKSCLSKQTLLLIDGHVSYFSIKAIDFCKSNGITLLAFPQHYSNTLNPLYRTLLGPLKTHINTSWDNWITSHPDTKMTVEHIPEIISTAVPRVVTPGNIKEAFKEAGIYPLINSLLLLLKFKNSVASNKSQIEARRTAAHKLDQRVASRVTVYIKTEGEESLEVDMDTVAEEEDPLADLSTVALPREHNYFKDSSKESHLEFKVEKQEEDEKYNPDMMVPQGTNSVTLDQSSKTSSLLKNNLLFCSFETDFFKTEEVKTEEVKVEVKEEDIQDA